MEKYEPISILLLIKELLDTRASSKEVSKQLETMSRERRITEKQLRRIYEKMALFSEEMEAIGGIEKYRLSNISWLKTELELLVECCQFCNNEGMKLTDIFHQISNEQTNVLPKTPSQITYIYYQIKKYNQPLERTLRKKAGRKKKENESVMEQKKQGGEVREKRTQPLKAEHSEKNFMKLLSGTMNNLAAIYQSQENSNASLYHLIEEIYRLSSIGEQSSKRTKECEKLKTETEILRCQQATLMNEQEKIVRNFRELTDCVQQFIDSPEMSQIIMLPKFINDSRELLENLELITSKENRDT